MSDNDMYKCSDDDAGYLQEIREKVRIGIEQVANGDYVEYTSETLHELFDEIEEEGLKRLEQRCNQIREWK